MTKVLVWLVSLSAAAYAGTALVKLYVASYSEAQLESVRALNLRENITVAELRDHLRQRTP